MKKICAFLVALMLVMPLTVFACADCAPADRLNITIDGVEVTIPPEYGAVQIVNDRTMVPVRFVSEHLGFSVSWLQEEQSVVFMSDTNIMHIVMFQIGGYRLFSEGRIIEMDVPAMIIDDRSYIPISFFAEAAGLGVYWNETERTVELFRG